MSLLPFLARQVGSRSHGELVRHRKEARLRVQGLRGLGRYLAGYLAEARVCCLGKEAERRGTGSALLAWHLGAEKGGFGAL